MKSATINIPISFIESRTSWASKKRFLRLKVGFPAIISVDECPYTKNEMKPLLALKWVSKHKGMYFLRAWKKISRTLNPGGGSFARIPVESLISNPIETLYTAALEWHLRIQPDRPSNAEVKRSKRGRMQFGEQSNGVSLSLMARFFGKSRSWASKMRHQAASVGLCHFERRFVPSSFDEFMRTRKDDITGIVKAKDGKYYREVSSECTTGLGCSFGKFWRNKKCQIRRK